MRKLVLAGSFIICNNRFFIICTDYRIIYNFFFNISVEESLQPMYGKIQVFSVDTRLILLRANTLSLITVAAVNAYEHLPVITLVYNSYTE